MPQAEQFQLAKESIKRALDVIERRKQDVLVVNRSGWTVLSELKSFDSSVFSEKESADISAARRKWEKVPIQQRFSALGQTRTGGSLILLHSLWRSACT